MKTKTIAILGLITALYVALTVAIAPIGFGIVQFRVAEVMKPLALKGKKYIIALIIGLVIANMFSPSVGAMELVFMPIMCGLGGLVSYLLRGKPFIATTLYAVIISIGVATTLLVTFNAPFWITFASVSISELILMHVGRVLIDYIFRYSKVEK